MTRGKHKIKCQATPSFFREHKKDRILILSDHCEDIVEGIILTHFMLNAVWGLPIYQHISMKNVWQNCYNTNSLWPPTNSGPQICASFTGFRICKKYLQIFLGVRLPQTCLSLKSPKIGSFLFESVFKLTLWNMKNIFSLTLLGQDMKRCVLPFFVQAIHNLFFDKPQC